MLIVGTLALTFLLPIAARAGDASSFDPQPDRALLATADLRSSPGTYVIPLTVTSELPCPKVPMDPTIDFGAVIRRAGLQGVLDPNSIEVIDASTGKAVRCASVELELSVLIPSSLRRTPGPVQPCPPCPPPDRSDIFMSGSRRRPIGERTTGNGEGDVRACGGQVSRRCGARPGKKSPRERPSPIAGARLPC